MPTNKRDKKPGKQTKLELPRGVKLLRTLEGHEDVINRVAIDSTGQAIASGSKDNTVKLWDVTSGRLLRTLEGHSEDVNCVAFDSDGKIIASGSKDNTVK